MMFSFKWRMMWELGTQRKSVLKRIRKIYPKIPLVQLIGESSWFNNGVDYKVMQTTEGLQQIATYAQGIGPWCFDRAAITRGASLDFSIRTDGMGLGLGHPSSCLAPSSQSCAPEPTWTLLHTIETTPNTTEYWTHLAKR